MMLPLIEEYERGMDSYWAGQIPTGWENSRWSDEDLVKAARSPYIMGWYQASLSDLGHI